MLLLWSYLNLQTILSDINPKAPQKNPITMIKAAALHIILGSALMEDYVYVIREEFM
jgi:hypothetical protein